MSGFGGSFVGGFSGAVVGQAVVEIVVDSSGVDDALSQTQKRVAGLAVAGLGAAVVAAIGYETAMTNVAKTTGATDAEVDRLRAGFRDMAKEIPVSASALADIGATAAQLGIQTENIESFTATIAKLQTATNIVGEEGAADLARFINVMGESQGNVERLGSAIVELGNNGASTEREILEMATRIGSAGRTVGLTSAQTLGLANALSSVGLQAEMGGTAASTILTRMWSAAQRGAPAVAQFAQVAGMLPEEFLEIVRNDPARALVAFAAGADTAYERGVDLEAILGDIGLSGVRAQDTLRRIAGAQDLVTESLETGTRAYEENTALQSEFERFLDSTGAQLQITLNHLTDLGITLGDTVLPWLNLLLDAIVLLADGFSKLPEPVQLALFGLGAYVTVGPAVVAILGGMAGATGTLTASTWALTAALAANPIALGAVAIGLGVGAGALVAYAGLSEFAEDRTRSLSQAMEEEGQAQEDNNAARRAVIAELEREIARQEAAGMSTAGLRDEVARLTEEIVASEGSMNAAGAASDFLQAGLDKVASATDAAAGAAGDAVGPTGDLSAAYYELADAAAEARAEIEATWDAAARRQQESEQAAEAAGRGDPSTFPSLRESGFTFEEAEEFRLAGQRSLAELTRARERAANRGRRGGGGGGGGGAEEFVSPSTGRTLEMERDLMERAGIDAEEAHKRIADAIEQTNRQSTDLNNRLAQERLDAARASAEAILMTEQALAQARTQVVDRMLADQVDAYLRGGDAELAAVQLSQESILAQIDALAAELHQKVGGELPDIWRLAADAVLKETQSALAPMLNLGSASGGLATHGMTTHTSAAGEIFRIFRDADALAAAIVDKPHLFAAGETPILGSEFNFNTGQPQGAQLSMPVTIQTNDSPAAIRNAVTMAGIELAGGLDMNGAR